MILIISPKAFKKFDFFYKIISVRLMIALVKEF
jgi:hypothetical protein